MDQPVAHDDSVKYHVTRRRKVVTETRLVPEKIENAIWLAIGFFVVFPFPTNIIVYCQQLPRST